MYLVFWQIPWNSFMKSSQIPPLHASSDPVHYIGGNTSRQTVLKQADRPAELLFVEFSQIAWEFYYDRKGSSEIRQMPLRHSPASSAGQVVYRDGHTLRFSELQKLMPYVTNATLSSQLKTLEQEGLIRRSVYPEVPPRVEYELTDIGHEFEPVLSSIAVWGEKYMDWKNKAS